MKKTTNSATVMESNDKMFKTKGQLTMGTLHEGKAVAVDSVATTGAGEVKAVLQRCDERARVEIKITCLMPGVDTRSGESVGLHYEVDSAH